MACEVNLNPSSKISNQRVIVSWNCRGIRNKMDDIKILINDIKPVCICIQETKLGEINNFKISNFTFLHQHKEVEPGENLQGE